MMKFLNGFWFNAIVAFIMAFYSVSFFTGHAVADNVLAGLMAAALFSGCLKDALKAKSERKGV